MTNLYLTFLGTYDQNVLFKEIQSNCHWSLIPGKRDLKHYKIKDNNNELHHLYGWVTKTYFFTNTMEELINTELIYLDFLLMSKY